MWLWMYKIEEMREARTYKEKRTKKSWERRRGEGEGEGGGGVIDSKKLIRVCVG